TAYVLYLNELVEDDFVLNRHTFADVVLPNQGSFVSDNRPDTNNRRCMRNCKNPGTIRITSMVDAPQKTRGDVVAPEHDGAAPYRQACALCHDDGIGGAPTIGDSADWLNRSDRSLEMMTENAINGFQGESGIMPPKGGFLGLTNEAVRSAVEYMLEQGQ
ncbi:MAG: cytochrome c5 family protein, partial [Gammaproteobacteria bacterium]|nr:cytochrome c5 family protein [Gammaproteobacteria bacterium]